MDVDHLRHMTSAGHLSTQRSPRISHRLGSRSPNSIPSSPTSVHSSSSAIFERDIESSQHRVSRSKATEQSVPSVLDSAASVLATLPESNDISVLDHVAVVAPAPAGNYDSILAHSPSSGFASPIGSFRSRSPSPLGLRVAISPGVTIPLLNIPPPVISGPHNPVSLTSAVPVPSPPAVVPPSESLDGSPSAQPMTSSHSIASPTSLNATLSHPPSPTHGPSKRLSFISYSDLLSSTPASTLPLSSLTTSASSMEPPPHIPSLSGLGIVNPHSPTTTTVHRPVFPRTSSAATSVRGFPSKRDSTAIRDDIGGEWQREGLGKGLEERLEALIAVQPLAGVKS